MRQVAITFADGADFTAALNQWLDAEPFIDSVNFGLGRRVTITLLQPTDATTGGMVDDRPRAVAMLRRHIPLPLVSEATVDGRDWLDV